MRTLVNFIICLVAASLAGCGSLTQTQGSVPPVGTYSGRSASQILPGTQSGDLLYATTTDNTYVYIMSYPTIRVLHQLGPFKASGPPHLCADSTDVYVLAPGPISTKGHYEQSYIYVYKRGSTTPTRILNGPIGEHTCAADSASGDLAVVNGGGQLSIYRHSMGQPKVYNLGYYGPCDPAYGDGGTIYVIASACTALAVFEQGGLRFFSAPRMNGPMHIQWDAGQIVGTTYARGWPSAYHQDVYLMKPERSHKLSVQLVELDRKFREEPTKTTASWVEGNTIIAPDHQLGSINAWNFPSGGNPVRFARAKSLDSRFTQLLISPGS